MELEDYEEWRLENVGRYIDVSVAGYLRYRSLLDSEQKLEEILALLGNGTNGRGEFADKIRKVLKLDG